MELICKNCGGKINFDSDSKTLFCEFCGTTQPLNNSLSDKIYEESEKADEILTIYQKALNLMKTHTLNSMTAAASIFKRLSGVFDSDILAEKCEKEIVVLRTEATYQSAVSNMQSGELGRMKYAKTAFNELGDYKDSILKSTECEALIKPLEEAERIKQIAYANEQKRLKEKRKKRNKAVLFLAVVAIIIIFISKAKTYSASNVKILIEPNENNYLTETYNGYVFNYDIKIKNKGRLDIEAIKGDIIFEDENGEIIVDTEISFYNYSSAVVRAKKSSKYTWELKISSYDTALLLYESDFDDIDVKIDITEITYSNGKTKTYK